MKRFLILAAVIGGSVLAIPASASAGITERLDAADQVQRVAAHRYGIDPIASCRQIGSRKFTCTIFDYANSCSYSGRANVRKSGYYTYRVTSMRVRKSCF